MNTTFLLMTARANALCHLLSSPYLLVVLRLCLIVRLRIVSNEENFILTPLVGEETVLFDEHNLFADDTAHHMYQTLLSFLLVFHCLSAHLFIIESPCLIFALSRIVK
jgi:hypothetical protein